ncbi:TMV resistance protein N [Quillaja saponaria]|uniref:TMV resistance protein N n=1 Tax=Quillaja saponaria TaxID=32244 RepID=A0AAD7L960_QUISA|nr:TMV resistance protein N [Quillaja saponaria]
MSGCTSCSSAVKRRFSKVSLRNSYNLSIPGNRIPNWFLGESITFSKCKNRELKYVIIGVVVSLNDYLPAKLRNQLPGVVEIQANILNLDKPLFSTTLNLCGVPKTNEEHIHLCRFPDYHPLVSKLKDGYTLSVTKRNPPALKGVELKKRGIYLVFEGDDDYDGVEPMDGTQQSVSEKLAKFFHSLEKDDPISGPDCEDEILKQLQMKGQEERKLTSSYSKSNFTLFFIVSFVFLCLSWLWLRLH